MTIKRPPGIDWPQVPTPEQVRSHPIEVGAEPEPAGGISSNPGHTRGTYETAHRIEDGKFEFRPAPPAEIEATMLIMSGTTVNGVEFSAEVLRRVANNETTFFDELLQALIYRGPVPPASMR